MCCSRRSQLVVIDAEVIAQITAEGVNLDCPMSSLRERSTVPSASRLPPAAAAVGAS